jgi:hypothetical protein
MQKNPFAFQPKLENTKLNLDNLMKFYIQSAELIGKSNPDLFSAKIYIIDDMIKIKINKGNSNKILTNLKKIGITECLYVFLSIRNQITEYLKSLIDMHDKLEESGYKQVSGVLLENFSKKFNDLTADLTKNEGYFDIDNIKDNNLWKILRQSTDGLIKNDDFKKTVKLYSDLVDATNKVNKDLKLDDMKGKWFVTELSTAKLGKYSGDLLKK